MMKPVVHLLATCRNPELLPATLLIFRTLRTGFPTAEVFVTGNNLDDHAAGEVMKACSATGAVFKNNFDGTVHHEWIEELIQREENPFFICDSDQLFWSDFERFSFAGETLAGRLIPRFYDEVTACITYERLHTSLLYINPVLVRRKMRHILDKLCTVSPFHIEPNLVYQQHSYLSGQPYFHDTMSLLYNAIGGQAFTPAQLDCFDHCNCGTYIDLVESRFTLARDLRSIHKKIFEHPEFAKGMWRQQEKYYERFAA